jgi:YggT family protein
MIIILINLINYITLGFTLLLIAYVVLSYFMDPYHPVRMTINRIVDPMLNPIRRLLPQTGMVDFSPLVAIILIQLIEFILRRIIISLAS